MRTNNKVNSEMNKLINNKVLNNLSVSKNVQNKFIK